MVRPGKEVDRRHPGQPVDILQFGQIPCQCLGVAADVHHPGGSQALYGLEDGRTGTAAWRVEYHRVGAAAGLDPLHEHGFRRSLPHVDRDAVLPGVDPGPGRRRGDRLHGHHPARPPAHQDRQRPHPGVQVHGRVHGSREGFQRQAIQHFHLLRVHLEERLRGQGKPRPQDLLHQRRIPGQRHGAGAQDPVGALRIEVERHALDAGLGRHHRPRPGPKPRILPGCDEQHDRPPFESARPHDQMAQQAPPPLLVVRFEPQPVGRTHGRSQHRVDGVGLDGAGRHRDQLVAAPRVQPQDQGPRPTAPDEAGFPPIAVGVRRARQRSHRGIPKSPHAHEGVAHAALLVRLFGPVVPVLQRTAATTAEYRAGRGDPVRSPVADDLGYGPRVRAMDGGQADARPFARQRPPYEYHPPVRQRTDPFSVATHALDGDPPTRPGNRSGPGRPGRRGTGRPRIAHGPEVGVRSASSSSFRMALTRSGFACPRVAFITCPTRKANARSLPAK